MGSPDFAVPTLSFLIARFGADALHVFTRPDAQKGRGKKTSSTPIKQLAESAAIPVSTPLNKSDVTKQVQALNPTFVVVVAYGIILEPAVVDHYLCLNLHGSILPAWRGASPIHAALLNGDSKTGVTLIHMTAGMDEGDILHVLETVISEDDHFQHLHDRLSVLSAETLRSYLDIDPDLTLSEAVAQDASQASYCRKLKAGDAALNPSLESTEAMYRRIRAFSPIPGAYIEVDGKRVKILEASLKDGRLHPGIVKPEGKRAMAYGDYLLAHPPLVLAQEPFK